MGLPRTAIRVSPKLEAKIERAFCCRATDPDQKNYGIRGTVAGVRFWRPTDLEEALANIPGQDADCVGLIGVTVYSSVPAWSSRSRAEQEEHDAMREIEIHDYARQLLEAHGAKAVAEAAQNAIDLEAKGEVELARTWRHIEDALKLMRGPHQS
jgi:hypothetical protein